MKLQVLCYLAIAKNSLGFYATDDSEQSIAKCCSSSSTESDFETDEELFVRTWAFDRESQKCNFLDKGAVLYTGTISNNFETKEECENKCINERVNDYELTVEECKEAQELNWYLYNGY